jgi:Transposase
LRVPADSPLWTRAVVGASVWAGSPDRAERFREHCAADDETRGLGELAVVSAGMIAQQGERVVDGDRSLGRTLLRWKDQIAAWHRAQVSNGPTEGANNLIKRIKRVAFGFTNFRNYRVRVLLYAGKPNWDLLAACADAPV